MSGWLVLIGILVGVTGLVTYIARRWGRGAHEKTFDDPLNEIQTTNPWKMWPL